jgi:predicted ATPase
MLRQVRLQNFKSFQDATINLGLRNFLVGPNMSGKSNFIQVFRFLQQVAFPKAGVPGLLNAFAGGFFEWTWKGGDSNLIRIGLDGTAQLLNSGADAEWTYELAILGDDRGSIRVQDERLSVALGDKRAELIANKGGTRSLVNLDGHEIYPNVEAGRSALEFEIPGWDGAVLRKGLVSVRFYRLVPILMRQFNPAAAAPFLNERGDNLSAWLMNLQTR